MLTRRLRAIPVVLAAFLSVLSAPAAVAERVALVVGNAAYAHAPRLANPLNDAADVGVALQRLGFTVDRLDNADKAELEQALHKLSQAAAGSQIALVFYAGHGIEVDKHNFLVPVSARLASEQDVEFETVPLELVMRAVGRASGLGLVILDACRENPFVASMRRSQATRSIGRGLARVDPPGQALVWYAAREGQVASDGGGQRNSPYAAALLAHIETPGLEVMQLFREVRDTVLESTAKKQEPFVYGSLSSQGVYLTAGAELDPAFPTAVPPPVGEAASDRLAAEELAAERVFWESVKDSTNLADIQAYLDHYPGGAYEVLARNRLKGIAEPPGITPEMVELGRADRRLIQLGLLAAGFDLGMADGLIGDRTRAALRQWQALQGAAVTGYLDVESARLLLASGKKREAQVRREAEAGRQMREQEARERAQHKAAAEAERQRRERQEAEERSQQAAAELAARQPIGDKWFIAKNQSCQVYFPYFEAGDTFTWSGECVDRKASGEGRLAWEHNEASGVYKGWMRGGRFNGQGAASWANGDRYEGDWRNDKRHGRGIRTWANGGRYKGEYRNDKPNGQGAPRFGKWRTFLRPVAQRLLWQTRPSLGICRDHRGGLWL